MIVKNKIFIVFVISLSLFIENGEAGWKFWKKDKETTTTTTAVPISDVQPTATATSDSAKSQASTLRGPTMRPATNIGTVNTVTGAASPGLAVGVDITGQNVRPNRPNPGTEIGLDIPVQRPNRPTIGGNGQNYRDWAVDLTGAGESSRNQPSRTPVQGSTRNSADQVQPNSPTGSRSTPLPASRSTQPSVADSKLGSTPHHQPSPQSTSAATRLTSVQPVQPHAAPADPFAGIALSNPDTSSTSSGKSWADVAAGGSRPTLPTGLPRQPEYPRQSTTGENARGTTGGRPTQSSDSRLAGGIASISSASTGATGTAAAIDSTKKMYSSNPTYSKGNTITDEDLEKLSEALFIKETNNANQYITLNLQKQTTSSSPQDEAPQPLLTVNPEALQITTVQRVLSIFDNYQLDTHTNEYISPAQRQEESLLVDTFLSTNVMSAAMRFLANKGFVRQDYYEYKDTLRRIWFNLFSRGQGKIGSTGFEHVFMAETRQGDSGSTEVLGLHNWIYFNAEEIKRRVDYLGYMKKIDLGDKGSIIKMHAKFNSHDKPVTAMFVGTSPELEMALYTVCFYARPDGKCPVSLGGTKFNIVTYKFKYRGKDLVGTAYPEI